MFFDSCTVERLNWLQDPDDIDEIQTIHIHIRYNHDGIPCHLIHNENGTVTAKFEAPQFAVTPGQSAVFYSGDYLLGGGIIVKGYQNR